MSKGKNQSTWARLSLSNYPYRLSPRICIRAQFNDLLTNVIFEGVEQDEKDSGDELLIADDLEVLYYHLPFLKI